MRSLGSMMGIPEHSQGMRAAADVVSGSERGGWSATAEGDAAHCGGLDKSAGSFE